MFNQILPVWLSKWSTYSLVMWQYKCSTYSTFYILGKVRVKSILYMFGRVGLQSLVYIESVLKLSIDICSVSAVLLFSVQIDIVW